MAEGHEPPPPAGYARASNPLSTNWKKGSQRAGNEAISSLDHSLDLFSRGIELSDSCRKQLEEAETRVETLIRKEGTYQPEAFRPEK